jgi:N-formylglutamate amidohydrolase
MKLKPQPILHIPHSHSEIPPEYRDQFVLTASELDRETLRMVDHFTEELFVGGCPQALTLVFPVSRLLVDVERFADDAEEPMAASGMGVLYRMTHDLCPLRRELSSHERETLMERYYHPHHRSLTELVDQQLEHHGQALIIDCHSFPSRPLPYQGLDATSRDFPEICIGTDAYHTPNALRDCLLVSFAEQGFVVGLNHPFAGALTPLKHYRTDKRVNAIMIEVRRDLYMDEETGERSSGFERVQSAISHVVSELG